MEQPERRTLEESSGKGPHSMPQTTPGEVAPKSKNWTEAEGPSPTGSPSPPSSWAAQDAVSATGPEAPGQGAPTD